MRYTPYDEYSIITFFFLLLFYVGTYIYLIIQYAYRNIIQEKEIEN